MLLLFVVNQKYHLHLQLSMRKRFDDFLYISCWWCYDNFSWCLSLNWAPSQCWSNLFSTHFTVAQRVSWTPNILKKYYIAHAPWLSGCGPLLIPPPPIKMPVIRPLCQTQDEGGIKGGINRFLTEILPEYHVHVSDNIPHSPGLTQI